MGTARPPGARIRDRLARGTAPAMVTLTDAEWKVMHRVWEREEVTARQVLDEVEDQTRWAYTTVKTLMNRLVDKGVLSVRMEGNTGVYSARVGKAQARVAALRDFAEMAFDGAMGPIMHFVLDQEELSEEDRRELRRKLAEADPASGAEPGSGPDAPPDGAGERR